MIYLRHDKDTNCGSAGNIDASLPAMRTRLDAAHRYRTAHVPEVQIALLGQGTRADHVAGTHGGEAW